MRRFRSLAVAAVATMALLGTGQARADFYDTAPTSFPTTTVPFADVPLVLPGFNTSLGTLTGVIIHLSTTITDSVAIVNTTGTTQSFSNATSTLTVTVSDSLGTTVSASLLSGPVSGTLTSSTATQLFGTVTGTVSGTSTDSNLAFFIGSPTITLSAAGNTGSYTGNAGAGVFFGGQGAAGGSVYLTYFYSPVPEPTSFALLGLGGVAGLVVRQVRRRRTA